MNWKNINSDSQKKLSNLKNKDPYLILQVANDASLSEVMKSYKRLMKIYHPDLSDDFMADYNQELVKIFNGALEEIKKIKKND